MAPTSSRRLWARIERAWTFLCCWFVAPLSLAVLVATVASMWEQVRLFIPYGPSIGFDQTTLVIEREFPNTLGYRYVGSAGERPIFLSQSFVVAWSPHPDADSQLRRDKNRWWLPSFGTHRFNAAAACYFLRLPAPLLWVILTLPSVRAWHARLQRRGKDRCKSCGYHLAGLSSTSSCPECGSRIPDGAAH
ncbi:MAG TPA: hypothetical protein PKE29_08590 [Phycisphaerales bacterium]|nr:hypothetical protein [Phycisphaerales bacterium]